jgi:hypothetical protein
MIFNVLHSSTVEAMLARDCLPVYAIKRLFFAVALQCTNQKAAPIWLPCSELAAISVPSIDDNLRIVRSEGGPAVHKSHVSPLYNFPNSFVLSIEALNALQNFVPPMSTTGVSTYDFTHVERKSV